MQPTDLSRRRRLLAAGAAVAAPFLMPSSVLAGAQQYEPMADAVRVALAAQIADPRPPARRFDKIEHRIAYLAWVGEMSERLGNKVGDYAARVEFLKTLDYEATRSGLDRQLVLALIQIESNFRKYAISIAGARGLMQVMPFWTRVIGDGESRHLFSMATNLRYGTVILRHYLDVERGDLFMALGRYNGSRGRAAYPDSILSAWKSRWTYEPKPTEQPAPNPRIG
ncbi:MAG TPA: lytic transglycosylase domain-containing protein [Burkholderiaceae bacterium]|nr:lytic transglycosylase domain-containing protein [Burkholderiaceae bacterium]